MSYIVLDTETTGLPNLLAHRGFNKLPIYPPYFSLNHYNKSRLVQFSWITYSNNQKLSNDFIIYPTYTFNIPEICVKIHNISTKKAKQEGFDIHFVLDVFLDLLKNVDKIVAHNIQFDIHVILSECFRHKRFDVIQEVFKKKWECTMDIGTKYYKYKKQRISLKMLYKKLFNKEFENAHNALFDTIACDNCYREMLNID